MFSDSLKYLELNKYGIKWPTVYTPLMALSDLYCLDNEVILIKDIVS